MSHVEKVAALRALRVAGLPRFKIAADGAISRDVYFIRRGEATHNVAPRPWGEELIDARLTENGRRQAAEGLRPVAESITLDVVFVSPLARALETAAIGLAPHMEIGVPFISVEGCREQLGPNLPDKRRPKAVVSKQFPGISFDEIVDGVDPLFMTEREHLPMISKRADEFLQWLHERPAHEQRIAVVTHSSFLAALCNVALDCTEAPDVEEWFANAEMRHVRLASLPASMGDECASLKRRKCEL